MVIWRGKGLLLLVSIFAGGIASGLVGSMAANLPVGPLKSLVAFLAALAFGVSALVNHIFCKTLLKNEGRRRVVDPKTGQAYILNNVSRFYFIPNTTWTYILLAIYPVAVLISGFHLVASFF